MVHEEETAYSENPNTLETGYKNTIYPRGKWYYIWLILISDLYYKPQERFGSQEKPSYGRIILIFGLVITSSRLVQL